MLKRFTSVLGIAVMLFSFAACHNKKVTNPIAQVDSKQPDKILFDRAMDAMKHNKFDVARLTLQTLINTYPDSEFVARAKLAVGDSWYAEGGSAAMTQAENEYKDFITFFPNMPEAAEAQLKIANIHYREMEKPDRDFTHAKRAEEEYRQLLIQFPDSKLVPEAKQRLMEVQEVLAEREFRIGKFYFMRESWNASIARLQSLVDAYPLYSGADEALFLLGNAHERQADAIRALPSGTGQGQIPEALKGAVIKKYEDEAAAAYDQILKRYPVMARADAAKSRLEALHRPVPTPTPEAIALNKKEQESRSETGMWDRLMGNIHKGPDMAAAAKFGEPSLVDAKPTNAPELIRQSTQDITAAAASLEGNSGKVSVETLKPGEVPANQPVPRSDNSTPPADNSGIPELQPVPDASQPDNSTQTAAPPTQLNEVQQPQSQQTASDSSSSSSSSSTTTSNATTDGSNQNTASQQKSDDKQPDYSTSKKKKKSGLRKIVPF
ncbi:MAG TPA: outer membrane protein assembly factor BamD [Terriglobales bacterium]|nr:outer membrane protein assembly factor BamD [Terriglobales bacterium]